MRFSTGLLKSTLLLLLAMGLVFAATETQGKDTAGKDTAGKGTPESPAVPVADVIYLSAEEPGTSEESAGRKLLCREILRQAVLISARDEAGLATRDRTLREDAVSGAPNFLAVTSRNKSKYYRLSLYAASDPKKPIFKKRLTVPDTETDLVDYVGLITEAEVLTRSKLNEFWKEQKLVRQANRVAEQVEIPAKVLEQLKEMNCFSQFAAIRSLHELHRTEGESQQSLGALSRAYANLGQLVLLHWNASHTVYQSRALLYAQRLVARYPDSAFALWNRAYALAMVGMHQSALDDLQAAEKLADKAPEVPANSRPDWVALIDGLCRYSYGELIGAAEKNNPSQQLAWLCAYLSVEPGKIADDLRLSTGFRALQANPLSLRISNSMSLNSGISTRHRTTLLGAIAIRNLWRAKLLDMPHLPDSLLAEIRKLPRAPRQPEFDFGEGADITAMFKDLPKLLAAAKVAGDEDRGELSASALGRLLEDMCFLEVAQRQDFLKNGLGVPVDGFCPHASKLFAEHPYVSFFQSGPLDPRRDGEKYWKLFEELNIVDADTSQYLLMKATWESPFQKELLQGEEAFALALTHSDHAAYAYTYCLQFANKTSQVGKRSQLLTVFSPYCPLGIATRIRLHWKDYAEEQADKLEETYVRQPTVLAALARGYLKQGRDEDAMRVLEKYLVLSPDVWAFEGLADLYLKEGDTTRWQATLDESLEHQDYGLSHARVRVKVARYLMEQKEWEQARPYAVAAAETGAAWAMYCAADCFEGLGEWDNSEEQVRYISTRYAGSEPQWYFWCRRTGHGDLDEARKLAAPHIDRLKTQATPEWSTVGWYALLEDDLEGANLAFREVVNATMSPYYGMQLVMLMDELGRKPERDAALEELLRNGAQSKQSPNRATVLLAKAMQEAILHDGEGLDLAAVDRVIAESSPEDAAEVAQFMGPYLVRHGKLEQGLKYFEMCDAQPFRQLSITVARTRLRAMKNKTP